MTVIRQRAAVDGVVAGAAAWHGPDVRRCGPGATWHRATPCLRFVLEVFVGRWHNKTHQRSE